MRAAQIQRRLGGAGKRLPRTELPREEHILAAVRSSYASHSQFAPGTALAAAGSTEDLLNLEMTPRDYITYLLSIDAEIEHCLMVQYLYAAYSIGGPDVPEAMRDLVRGWQEVVLGIAKEEMGHLITVQNVLRVIGAPLHLEREDYPWDVPFYPFPFMLEPFSLSSLAKYVYTESAVDWDGGVLGAEIRALVATQTTSPHKVAELFAVLFELLKDPLYLKDEAFEPETYPCQADWAEWGRGYKGGSRGNSTHVSPSRTPDVLVVPVTSREEVIAALEAISEQGEATLGSQASHFVRFFQIYVEMRNALGHQPCSQELWDSAIPPDFDPIAWHAFILSAQVFLCR